MIMNMSLKKKKKKLKKSLIKKNHLKNQQKIKGKTYELINQKETDINKELFQKHFSFSKPSAILRDLYRMKDKKIKS